MAAGDVTAQLSSQAIRTGTFNDGTVSGGVTISDGAMVFDGSGSVAVASNMLNNSNTFSISLWASWNDLTGNQRLLNGDSSGEGMYIRKTTGNAIDFLATGLSDDYLSSGFIVTTGQDYHIVVVYNGTTKFIYINNVLRASEPATGNTSGIANFRIGSNRIGLSDFMKGTINNVLIFPNRALSPTEIALINASGKDAYSPVTDGLVAQYSGRDYTGTAAAPKRIQDTATFNRSTARTFQTVMESLRKNTNANSKFVFDEVNNGVMLAHIEEAA